MVQLRVLQRARKYGATAGVACKTSGERRQFVYFLRNQNSENRGESGLDTADLDEFLPRKRL